MSRAGEFEWISRYLAPLAGETSFGLLDDAALLTVPIGKQLVVTQDAIFENIHFLPDDPLDQIAQKALRVNVSDITAKGAVPFAYSLALGVPDRWGDTDMEQFCIGLSKDQHHYGLKLSGGDTYRSPEHLCVSVTMFGAVSQDAYVSRLGAQSGDLIVVSGTIGDSAVGLKLAKGEFSAPDEDQEFLLNSFRVPQPPAQLAPLIAQYANAAMDVSDGLLGDATKLCRASGMNMKLNRACVPLSGPVKAALTNDLIFWPTILGGGDDYQCLFSLSPENWNAFQQQAQEISLGVTVIGEIVGPGDGSVSLHDEGVPLSLPVESFTHF